MVHRKGLKTIHKLFILLAALLAMLVLVGWLWLATTTPTTSWLDCPAGMSECSPRP